MDKPRAAPRGGGSGDEFAEPTGVRRATNLHRNAPSRAHRAAPQRVAVRMAHRHVDVRTAADPRGDIVDPKVQVLVHGRLEREWADDPRRKVFLRRADVSLRDVENVVQTRLAQGGGVVAYDDIRGDALCLVQGQLLVRRQPHVPVQGSLEPPIDPEQLELLRVILDRRVKEVEVEDGADDVSLDAGRCEVFPRDDALFDERLRPRLEFLVTRGGEGTRLQVFGLVAPLRDRDAIDVPRVLEFLRGRELRLFQDP